MKTADLLDRLHHDGSEVALVVNAASRRGRDALDRTRALLAAARVERVRTHAVLSGAELGATLDRVVAEGPGLLVVGGGDGTVGAAAHRVSGTDTVLGVVPLGTANDFARTLEVPPDPTAAVAALLSGRVADVDLGRVEDASGRHTFLNVASLGLSVGVTAMLTPGLKRRLGPAAYPVATLRAYRHHAPFSARLSFPGGDHPPLVLDDLMQVAVGNGRHYGGGNSVAPNASIDDHLLDVYAVERGRLRDHVSIARLLKDGRFVEHERVTHLTTRAVRIETDEPLPVNLDGEVSATTPLTSTVDRNALRVVIPSTSRAARFDGDTDDDVADEVAPVA
ncbi:lipid kinase [Nocardioides flavescens]|uniref:Lipid kinase n=1 Tax=Nocardioides flavescens TaxID=2691959 RepID=A0A6L7F2V2_9ACTN|nr:lipid kinase [Nocardioides flavescens]MXG90124.1 lipid kinase [Nocardioides flavescens]